MHDRPRRGLHLVERAAALLRADAAVREAEDLVLETPPVPDFPPAAEAPPRVPADETNSDETITGRTIAEQTIAGETAATPADAVPAATTLEADAANAPGVTPPGVADGEQPSTPFLDIATLRRAGLVLTGSRSRIAEEFRITVTRALRALRGNRTGRAGNANLLMVTSARPNEGKSFSALNVAASIALNGLSDVLLIDLDSKPRSLSALMGLGGRDGLLDLANGWGNPSAVTGGLRHPEPLIARTAIEGLWFLPIGSRRPGVEGTVTRAVSTTIERLSRRFPRHIVVIDTAPCLSTSDPSTLASLMDEVLMVVEAERTQRSEVEAALDLVKGSTNITLLLNKVQLTQRHSFGSYYYFDEPASE